MWLLVLLLGLRGKKSGRESVNKRKMGFRYLIVVGDDLILPLPLRDPDICNLM